MRGHESGSESLDPRMSWSTGWWPLGGRRLAWLRASGGGLRWRVSSSMHAVANAVMTTCEGAIDYE